MSRFLIRCGAVLFSVYTAAFLLDGCGRVDEPPLQAGHGGGEGGVGGGVGSGGSCALRVWDCIDGFCKIFKISSCEFPVDCFYAGRLCNFGGGAGQAGQAGEGGTSGEAGTSAEGGSSGQSATAGQGGDTGEAGNPGLGGPAGEADNLG